MEALRKNMWRSAVLLALFALIGTGLVAYTFDVTKDRIAASERAAIIRTLHSIVKPSDHDNDIFHDTLEVTDAQYLGSRKPVTVYRARLHGEPSAAVLTVYAPNGYSGAIKMLVGIRRDGSLAGARILEHRETPGLGDAIEAEKTRWIESFQGKSLTQPDTQGWHVKKDGGYFDQFTGATITPRAVVQAIHNALLYYKDHQDLIFGPAPPPGG